MGKYNRSLARDFGKLLIKDNDEEIKQYLEEERVREEKDMAWRQRKYELSNSFGEEILYFDDEKFSESYLERIYDIDEFGCLVSSKKRANEFDMFAKYRNQYPWLFDDENQVHPPDDLQNTRGYNYAFVSK
jgi:hypothetical protein